MELLFFNIGAQETMTAEHFPYDDTLWQVVAQRDGNGGEQFAKATEKLIGQELIFIVDDTLFAGPIRIQAKISGVIAINKSSRLPRKMRRRSSSG